MSPCRYFLPVALLTRLRCILAELLTGKPLFQGTNELETMDQIFRICGTPTREDWPDAFELSFFTLMKPRVQHQRDLRSLVTGPNMTDLALDLLGQLLSMNPDQRPTAQQALEHPYFCTAPFPLPTPFDYSPCHEMQSKEARRRRQEGTDNVISSPPFKVPRRSASPLHTESQTLPPPFPRSSLSLYPTFAPPERSFQPSFPPGWEQYSVSTHPNPKPVPFPSLSQNTGWGRR